MNKKITIILITLLPLAISCARESIMEIATETPVKQLDPWTVVPLPEIAVVNGSHSIMADNGEATKSHYLENGEHTHASVIWSAGDNIEMVGLSGEYMTGNTTYSTLSGGSDAVFTGGATITADEYHSFYPSTARYAWSDYYDGYIFGITIPSTQTATPGNISPEANVSYARSDTQEEKLHFKNVVSVIKFKLSGSVVSQLKSVTFRGVSDLAGDFIIYPNASGIPELLNSIYYPGHIKTRAVTLSGDFVAGTDYYIAVAPSYQDGFSMVFTHKDGTQKITKVSSRELTLNRSQITDFGTIALGDSFDTSASLTPYITHTQPKYATIAVVPDGYTSAQMDEYVLDAQAGIDALFNTEPYKSYKGYFNVWILKVASNESGARISDGTPAEQNRDCYFRSTWGSTTYNGMVANEARVFSFVEDNCPDILDGTHGIADVPILVIINDTRYGGIAWNYGSGATYCMVPKAYNGGPLAWGYPDTEAASETAVPWDVRTVTDGEKTEMGINTGTWKNTLVHEFGGHSIGKLSDEYWYNTTKSSIGSIASHSWPVPMGMNVSATYDSENVPWSELFSSAIASKIDSKPAGVKEKYSRIGIFQGADVSMFYRWRSERISCMIDNRFYFSTWQRYLIVNRIMTLAGLSTISLSTFLDNDVPTDPLRDGGSPVMLPDGVSNRVPPRPVPMLPPPRYVEDFPDLTR